RHGLGSEPAVRSRAQEFRRVERREVAAVRVVISLECRPRAVDAERRQSQEHEQRLRPPGIATLGLSEPAHRQGNGCGHGGHASDPLQASRRRGRPTATTCDERNHTDACPGFQVVGADRLAEDRDVRRCVLALAGLAIPPTRSSANIRRAAALPLAYQFSNPNGPLVENEYEHVKAENDWTS